MIILKSLQELAIMREGGEKLGQILSQLLDSAQPGIALTQIENQANILMAAAGGTASFKTVENYHWATCLCVNEAVVHGIPNDYILKDGDLLTVDVGLLYQGFHTDTAWTKLVKAQNSKPKEEKERFLKTGEEALRKAIDQAKIGNRIGHISQTIQSTIEGAGYSIVKSLVGHGVGRELHEAPQIPGFLRGKIEDTLVLNAGMTIAIEVIYAAGSGSIVYANSDGWTIATRDRSLSAVFEHTIAISAGGPLVLTEAHN